MARHMRVSPAAHPTTPEVKRQGLETGYRPPYQPPPCLRSAQTERQNGLRVGYSGLGMQVWL